MAILNNVTSLIKSFRYALRGLWFAISNERNMRIHIVTAIAITLFSFVFKISGVEFSTMILAIGFVVVCEMLNTAVEVIVNVQSPAYSNLARIAKDVAAGAVFVSALCAIGVGLAIFLKPQKLFDSIFYILIHFPSNVIAVVFVTAAIIFIFRGPKSINHVLKKME